MRWTWAIGHAISWTLAALLVVGLADYVIRFHDMGARVLASLVVVATIAWACFRYVRPVWRKKSTPLEMAQQIQRQYPGLEDRLASSLEFLGTAPESRTSGSSELRESVIRETTQQLEGVDFGELISTRAARRAAMTATGLLIVVAAVFALDTNSSRLALARMISPLADLPWPQRHHLAFRDAPRQLATGADFEIELYDLRDVALPDDVKVSFRSIPGEGEEAKVVVAELTHMVGGSLLARRENVTQSFEYRASGGDDDSMPWMRLDVIDPPRIASVEVMLYPPEYTGWKPYRGERRIRAYKGTRVEMNGRLTKPVREVRLQRSVGPSLAAELNDAGDEFRFAGADASAWVVDGSCSYWLELSDLEHDDLVGGRDDRWNIIALTDEKPTVVFEQPSRDVAVTAGAVLPLRIVAKDDLRTQSVDLRYRTSDSKEGEFETIRLMQSETKMELVEGGLEAAGDQHVVKFDWKLAELNLQPGTELLVSASAMDFKRQSSESSVRRLRIVKPTDLLEQVASRQAAILTDLARVRQLQIAAREQTTATRIQVEEVRKISAKVVDRAHSAMLSQQEVDRAVGDPVDGVMARIDAALSDIRSNNLDRDQIAQQIEEIASQVRRLHDDVLPIARRKLSAARKSAQDHTEASSSDDIIESLLSADRTQQEVIDTLDNILGKHAQWSGFHQLYREVARLKATQEKLLKKTSDEGANTVGRRLTDLTPEQQAELKKLAFSQTELSRQVEAARQQLENAGKKAESDGSQDSGNVRSAIDDAIRLAADLDLATKMRDAGKNLAANRIGEATKGQQQLVDSLGQLLDVLANRRERRLERLIERLKVAEQQLEGLREQQEQLRKRIAETRKEEDEEKRQRELKRLVKQQQELKKKVEQFTRELKRLQADRASGSASRAAKRMASAASAAESGNAGGAESMAQAAGEDLERATRELAQRRRQAEMDLASEKIASLDGMLRLIIQRQEAVIKETKELDASDLSRAAGGPWIRQAVAIARLQELLRVETVDAAKSMAALPIIRTILERAAKQMAVASALLRKRRSGANVLKAETEALRQLRSVLQALTSDSKDGAAGGDAAGGDGASGQRSDSDQIIYAAELRLVVIMQQQLVLRTAELEKQRDAAKELTPEEEAEFEDLRQQQAELADWIFKLTDPGDAGPEDRPEDFVPQDRDDPNKRPPGDPESIKDLLPSLIEEEKESE